jgi:UDP-hydrolysing UDP-N-acetyl-D-glucosamine 2-epimerase
MLPLFRALATDPSFDLTLATGAAHHDPRLGATGLDVEASGLPIGLRLPSEDGGAGAQAATVLAGLHVWLARLRPDALLLLGDRFEMLAAAQAATLTRVPVIHVGGGHLTLGAMDDRIRHAISKLAALHLVASDACAARVASLHENTATIYVTGAPELDALVGGPTTTREALFRDLELDPARPLLLATFHPETNVDDAMNAAYAAAAEAVLKKIDVQVLLTAPCADPGHGHFLDLCERAPGLRSDIRYVPSLGVVRFNAALWFATAMLGNSSSGIIESGTTGLPVVNVGRRQAMRERAANVIDCDFECDAMRISLAKAMSPTFRTRIAAGLRNPYGDGRFVDRTIAVLRALDWPLSVDKGW